MLRLRTHAIITAGIFVAINVLAMIGNALEASGAVKASPAARLAAVIIFLALSIALAFSVVPLMVKVVLGFQARRGGTGLRAIARERAIVFVMWGLMALGLAIAVPAAIVAGAFD